MFTCNFHLINLTKGAKIVRLLLENLFSGSYCNYK